MRLNPENKKKNVECQFEDSGFKYNIEVKCPDFGAQEKVGDEDAFKFSFMGRIPGYLEEVQILTSLLNEAQQIIEGEKKPFLNSKNMDNNLKDFLYSAHDKFPPPDSENELNVLVVGCNDAMDMQQWWGYLYAEEGLFTQESFAEIEKYRQVDLVVLTNLYHRHHKYFEKKVLSDFWKLNAGSILYSKIHFASPLNVRPLFISAK